MPDAEPGSPEARPAGQATSVPDGPPPPGTMIEVRDEEWMVRNGELLPSGECLIEAIGASDLVRGHEARFLSPTMDRFRVLRPEDTKLLTDGSPHFRRSRLFLEAVLRKTPLPQIERRLALTDGFLLDRMDYQLRPAAKALRNPLRPRLLIGDVVGLGKTLEIGVLLGELIRRGRGERILVVTPAPVLEQFQHEMWTRFSLPLVRLDSAGIARIERKIPAGRNPFTYYKRVIISMDTLKNPKRYRPWLENIHWDAVVIDESHNLINRGSDRRALADLLAERSDALILASATPHNGDMPAFSGLIRLLDPMAIKDPRSPKAGELHHVMLRRTKVSAEVADQLKDHWAPRGGSHPIRCQAGDLEEKVFQEFAGRWLKKSDQDSGGVEDRLFPYVLLKSFLSSHRALFTTARDRLAKTDHRLPGQHKISDPPPVDVEARTPEAASLLRLMELARAIDRTAAEDGGIGAMSKLKGLVEELRTIGVRAGSTTRAVVFSERRETLDWLGEVLPPLLGWRNEDDAKAAVKVLHSSGISDRVQMEYVDEFARAGSDVRLLLTGDGASEGVNLHRQCHHLIHWDLPWSLIRVEQRNGRIDRYGQTEPPEFRAMILESAVEGALDDTDVAEKVLAREEKVHAVLGAVEAATQENDGALEEKRVMEALFKGEAPQAAVENLEAVSLEGDSVLADLPLPHRLNAEFGTDDDTYDDASGFGFDFDDVDGAEGEKAGNADHTDDTAGAGFDFDDAPGTASAASATAPGGRGRSDDPQDESAPAGGLTPLRFVDELRLFTDRRDYVLTGLEELADLESFRLDTTVDGTDLSFDTPEDLADRLDVLPSGYLRDHGIAKRMKLTFSREDAADSLRRAREDADSSSLWPDAHYVGELHPVLEWITDKVLVQLGRQQAPVIQVDRAEVPDPVFLTQGVWANNDGRPTVVAWLAVDRLADGPAAGGPRVRELTRELLAELGLRPHMPDHFAQGAPETLQPLVPAAVAATRREMDRLRDEAHRRVDAPLREYEKTIGLWREQPLPGFSGGRTARERAAENMQKTAKRLRTTGEPMVRVLAALEPSS
ncbi:DEAD/DEAH box helicase [Streptomyces malaysiensis]|uniref:DEAD/DEAH box helicase n=1 Tax=Streptomyces malaysiensis TaxID=92644 RepID=UPI000BFF257C|nr:DEAD/DEAH box helicase [Streptomyces malaysiensis]ATL81794.1 DNA/RNA helicase, superfamily II, SNF2 family [Streptomyces malaysiensis]